MRHRPSLASVVRASRPRARALGVAAAALAFVGLAGCGGGGTGAPDMVLVSFNLPNIAGVPLNQPLVYTFSDNVDPLSVTPDTIQVNGSPAFTFESIVVDGNLVAELPFIPNFDDYSDAGLAPNRVYTVFLPIFPAVDTVRSVSGRPLIQAESFSFTTIPTFSFIEARRPLVHTPGPFTGPSLFGDEDGCLQNASNGLYLFPGLQNNTDADARLLCLAGEGAPRVLNNSGNLAQSSNPFHDKRAVGTGSATAPGTIDLGAMRVRFNEPLDPATVTPYVPTTQLSVNVQLWRVGDTDAVPLALPVQVKTTTPRVVQDLSKTEVILVPVGPEAQGTYLINIQSVKDLAGNFVVTADRPNPIPGGYGAIETAIVGKIAPGYRIYFRTLELPSTPNSITESFASSVSERRDGLFTFSTLPGNPVDPIPGSPALGSAGFTLFQAQPGQATVANWNDGYRFVGIGGSSRPSVRANTAMDSGASRLKATFAPYLGNGDDLDFNLIAGNTVLRTDGQDDFNGDGVFEFNSFNLDAGSTLTLTGSRPALILVRGACTISGTILCNGARGSPGFDTDATATYTNAGALEPSGLGGLGGPGGGNGGRGAPSFVLSNSDANAQAGLSGVSVLGDAVAAQGGGMGALGDGPGMVQGGGGGGFGTGGSGGSGAANGSASGSVDFTRALAQFSPERCYQPGANLSGGPGGGGGGIDDDNGLSETGDGLFTVPFAGSHYLSNGDDAGAGGGGGGGGLWIIASTIAVNGTIQCNGGAGGNTYAVGANHLIADPDTVPASGDEFLVGAVNPLAVGTGGGGAGGGGAGGGILLQARVALSVNAGASLTALGGPGGTAASAIGGSGGVGRIALMTFAGSVESPAVPAPTIDGGATISPAAGVSTATWSPTVDLTSQGVSVWIDFVTNVTAFSPAFWNDNFAALTGVGLTQGPGSDFNAILEFQGADTLSPNSTAPTGATGLTAWVTNIALVDNKKFVRWRWRFFVNRSDGIVGNNPDFDPTIHPMPQVLDFTIPFTK